MSETDPLSATSLSSFVLPWPPSVNNYWRSRIIQSRSGAGFVGVYMTKRAKDYRAEALGIIGRRRDPIAGDVVLDVRLFPPDRRKRDIDNILKPLLDVLSHARVYRDDAQVVRLMVSRCEVAAPGRVEIDVAPESFYLSAL